MKVMTERRWAIVCPVHGLLVFSPKTTRAGAQDFVKYAKGRKVVRCTVTYPSQKRGQSTVPEQRS